MSETPKSPVSSASPVPTNRLKQIANDACTLALEKVETYEHSRTEQWNTQIINHILRALISESTPPTPTTAPTTAAAAPPTTPWKFAVNSTIIQHLSPSKSSSSVEGAGRRGMHSACGAYWNNDRDGMWSHKHETKGMDVVISVIWVAV